MRIKSFFFKVHAPQKKIKKRLTVYISEKHSQIILAPIYQDSIGGYFYEQEICEIIDLTSIDEKIGETIKRNFNKFIIKKNKSINHNKSDWPAFKSSKEKTMVAFEKNYKRFSISGSNEYNLILDIETALNNLFEIQLTTTISYHCDNNELGKRIIKLYYSDIVHNK